VKLYLITHAHTAQVPSLDATRWKLSAQGIEQAEALAAQPFWDEVDCIVLSLEEKTRLTVDPVLATRDLNFFHDKRFNELKRGGWVEDYGAQVRQAFTMPDKPSGEWEPAAHGLERFLAGIADLVVRCAGQTVALVGHGLTLSLYRAYLLGQPQVKFEEWVELSFASVALVDPVAVELHQDFGAVAGHMPRR